MRSFDSSPSSISTMASSWPLRSTVLSPERKRFFASCCVMVEPPTTFGVAPGRARASVRWLRSQAFSIASHSTPLWSAKPASSLAMTARLRWLEIAAAGTQC